MSSPKSSPSNNHSSAHEPPPSHLPLREIPGGYGFPFFSPMNDRFNYFYNQGPDEFFRTRIQKYQSTIFRTNMPPGPFISSNPRVVVVLDAVSFPVLFDNSKVEKKDVLDGTYMPSTAYYGGYRPCAYLDTSEPNHTRLKSFFLSLISSLHHKFIPTFQASLSELFGGIEQEMLGSAEASGKNQADFNALSDEMSFNFMFRLFSGKYPSDTSLGNSGRKKTEMWLLLQLAPLGTLGLKYLPSFIEDFFLHTIKLPFLLVKSNYKKVYDAFYESTSSILDEAEKSGIGRDEACHNLMFLAWFNAFGGMKLSFPALIKWVGLGGESLHSRLAEEIRAVVKSEGGVTLSALDKMALTKSAVYEALRIEPPVTFQYGKAKKDIVVTSHDGAFKIKKGEMICGYQPFATKDPKVFANPEDFVADRFVGDGEKLIKYVYWSNGRESDNPTAENKQCPGKDLVVLLSRLMLVGFFIRYDTFTVKIGKTPFGSSVMFKSLTKAT